jgi:saccharopine dehydrogenase (NAD+, L-lysine forming)
VPISAKFEADYYARAATLTERPKILVVGGYGEVGRAVCGALAKDNPGRVIAAGRSLKKAEDYALAMQNRIVGRVLDLRKPPGELATAITDVQSVIMCVDRTDTSFVEMCLSAGINYIDVTASCGFLLKLKRLQSLAVASRATAVLGVGLAPGLATLLSAGCAAMIERPRQIDISLLLGAGDTHGEAAIRWTIENLLAQAANVSTKVIDFGAPWGKRSALPFAFSDQHAISESIEQAEVITRFAMDSRLAMAGFRLLRHWNPLGQMRLFLTGTTFARILGRLKVGSDAFVAKVEALGSSHDRPIRVSASCAGRREAKVTGWVASAVLKAMAKGRRPYGVYDIHEVFALAEICQYLPAGDVVNWPVSSPLYRSAEARS